MGTNISPQKALSKMIFRTSPGGICDRSLEGRICVSLFRCPESPDIKDLGKSVGYFMAQFEGQENMENGPCDCAALLRNYICPLKTHMSLEN